MYIGELTEIENIGKNSPGPQLFHGQDTVKFDNMPAWSMGTEARNAEQKPKYDFYENALFLDDPIEADLARKARCCAPKIGTEPRFQSGAYDYKPGPQYYPPEKPVYKNSEKYTLGVRRGNALKIKNSTPNSVGPGRYFPEACANPSEIEN